MFAIIFAGVLLRVFKKDMVRPPFRVLISDVTSNTYIKGQLGVPRAALEILGDYKTINTHYIRAIL